MQSDSRRYATRTIEPDIVAHIDAVRARGAESYEVVAVIGPRGYGVRSTVLDGILPVLGDRAARVHGEWSERAEVQFCGSEDDIPDTAPPVGSSLRLLLVACTDLTQLPGWLDSSAIPAPTVFTLGPLSLIEAQDFLEARLSGPVAPATVRTLANHSGFAAGPLAWMIHQCLIAGCLERVDGNWQLVGGPVSAAVLPYVRERLATEPAAGAVCRMALAEPVDVDQLDGQDAAVAATLVREGVLRRRDDGMLEFRAPAIAEALRRLSSAAEQERVHRAKLRAGKPTLATVRWAADGAVSVPSAQLDALAMDALRRHDWGAVAAIADLAEELPGTAPTQGTAAVRGRCDLHLHAAFAARFLPDPDLAHAHLDRAEDLVGAMSFADAEEVGIRIRITRAELLHWHEDDFDAALTELAGTTDSSANALSGASLARLLAHRIFHLVYGGRIGTAKKELLSGRRTLRRGSHRLRMRVSVAETLVMAASGKPQRALRRTTLLAAQAAVSARRAQWLEEELRSAYVVVALGSDGPDAFPLLERHLGDNREGAYRPDLATFYLARASWEFARGDIDAAHRHGERALATAEVIDPSGVSAAIVALLAETSMLSGAQRRAEELRTRWAHSATGSVGMINGSMQAHLIASRLLGGDRRAVTEMQRTAAQFTADGQYGSAAEALYAGVRFAARHAAQDLCDLAGELDGNLHRMRVAHAEALLADDPVALLAVSDRMERSGLHLYAAEAAASVARMSAVPDALRRRARERVAGFLEGQAVSGHPLLREWSDELGETRLTPREREVSRLIAEGLSNADIAKRLHLSLRTVEGHIARLYRKTGQRRRTPERRPLRFG